VSRRRMVQATLNPLPLASDSSSPTKLAHLTNATISDGRKTAALVRVVVDQCHTSQRITPLFRFLEAGLVARSFFGDDIHKLREFLETAPMSGVAELMSLDEPLVFNITRRVRELYIALSSISVDIVTKVMNIKSSNSCYGPKCQTFDYITIRAISSQSTKICKGNA